MVYLQSAKVTEEATVNLSSGKNVVRIIGLPNAIDENSYQVGLSNGATLLSVTPSTRDWTSFLLVSESGLVSFNKFETQAANEDHDDISPG